MRRVLCLRRSFSVIQGRSESGSPLNRINRSDHAHCVSEQGTLTIVRRSSGKSKSISSGNFESSPPPHNPDSPYLSSQSVDLDEILDNVDLTTDSLPAVDTPDACDKAALRYHIALQVLMALQMRHALGLGGGLPRVALIIKKKNTKLFSSLNDFT